ncbi:hypothetical protein D3C87_1812070 [compost metagenome]
MFGTPTGWSNPFPQTEGAVERILILISDKESHFFNIERRVGEIFQRLLMPGLRQQLLEAGPLVCKPSLQGAVAHP